LVSGFSPFRGKKNRLPKIRLRTACANTKIKWQGNATLFLPHILNFVKVKALLRIQTFVSGNFEPESFSDTALSLR